LGGHAPIKPAAPPSVRVCNEPCGNGWLSGSVCTWAGILATTQCIQPKPVGASLSYIVSTKLFVPLGAFFHEIVGAILPPVQPKP